MKKKSRVHLDNQLVAELVMALREHREAMQLLSKPECGLAISSDGGIEVRGASLPNCRRVALSILKKQSRRYVLDYSYR